MVIMLRLALQAVECFLFITIKFDSLMSMIFAEVLMLYWIFIWVSYRKKLWIFFYIFNLHQVDILFPEAHITFNIQENLTDLISLFLWLKASIAKDMLTFQKNWRALFKIYLKVASWANHTFVLLFHRQDFKILQTRKL